MVLGVLYYGDNLKVLRDHIHSESVDLVYLDPPFNSQAAYNVLFKEASGKRSAAQIRAFEDTWHWDDTAELTFREVIERGPQKVAVMLQSMRGFLGESDMMSYLVMMAPRLTELHRVLKSTGSLYLHCDPTASHYLKMLLDAVFGPVRFRNELIWKRTSAHNGAKRFGPVHDVLLFYTKSTVITWNQQYQEYSQEYLKSHYRNRDANGRPFTLSDLTAAGIRNGSSGMVWKGFDPASKGNHWKYRIETLERLQEEGRIYWPPNGGWPRYVRYLEEQKGIPLQDVWTDIDPVNAKAAERMGYPTQKPETLLERIIQASSNEGDVVLDPFCGCGTAISAAHRLNRNWIGIDITHLAIGLVRKRLLDLYGPSGKPTRVVGEPDDLESANALAVQDRFQFQCWALGLVGARSTTPDEVKGKDRGIDGVFFFFDDRTGQAQKVVLQVKSGHSSSRDIRDLKGAMEREKAVLAVFITLRPPTRDMMTEAVTTGYYEWVSPDGARHAYPKVQILTIAQLLDGQGIQMPPRGTYKQAPPRGRQSYQQLEFDLDAPKRKMAVAKSHSG